MVMGQRILERRFDISEPIFQVHDPDSSSLLLIFRPPHRSFSYWATCAV